MKSSKIFRGKMRIIVPAAFTTSFAIGMMGLGILFVVKDVYGAGALITGNLGALWPISYFIGCIALRKPAHRLKPRTAMCIMLMGSAAVIYAFLLFPGLVQAFVIYAVYGFITALFWPPLMGWMSRGFEGTQLNKATNLFSLAWSSGSIFSSYIAGLLSERAKFLPVLAAALLFTLNAVFVLFSRRYVRDDTEPDSSPDASAAPQTDRSTALRFPAWLGVFLVYAFFGVSINVFPVYAKDQLGLNESGIGLILTIRSLTIAIGFIALSRLTAWQYKRGALPALSLILTIICAILIFVKTSVGFMVFFAAAGFLHSVMYNNSLFYATSGALDKTRRATIHEALINAGQVFGSVSGGFLYSYVSMPSVFTSLGILALCGAAAQSYMVYKTDKSAARL